MHPRAAGRETLEGYEDEEALFSIAISEIAKSLDSKPTLVDVIVNIGKEIHRLQKRREQDNVLNAQVGWFVFKIFVENDVLSLYQKKKDKRNKKAIAYHIAIKDSKLVKELVESIDTSKLVDKPQRQPYADWCGFIHPEAYKPIIRKVEDTASDKFMSTNQSYTLSVLNKMNRTGWRINEAVFKTYKALIDETENTPFKFHKETNPQKRASLEIEARAVLNIAEENIGNVFYHLYNCDFRGRIYPTTAFLHEQSSDNAKGILMFDELQSLGENGLYWLMVHTANMWGNDKVSLDDRATFVEDNIDKFIGYAENPLDDRGWIDADKPFCFLACCNELRLISEWEGDVANFPSSLPLYIDGSNNGVQHLVAMSKDEDIAPLVNLVPQELPGDVYMFIAEHTWSKLKDIDASTPEKHLRKFRRILQLSKGYQSRIDNAKDQKEVNDIKARYAKWKNNYNDARRALMAKYWNAIDSKKEQRKIVKRNVMTLGYGGTRYGMGQQIIDDTYDISEYMRYKEYVWGMHLGNLVYDTCYEQLKGPARLLRMFQELADRYNEKEEDITWFSPITNFPVEQVYRQPTIEQTLLQYNKNGKKENVKLSVSQWKNAPMKKSRQKSGTAPNMVHSLDAVHLLSVVKEAPYTTTVVHDSFGCHAGNMEHMFQHVRNKFVDLYDMGPLEHILKQLDSLDLIPEKGNLDVSDVLRSDFAFA